VVGVEAAAAVVVEGIEGVVGALATSYQDQV